MTMTMSRIVSAALLLPVIQGVGPAAAADMGTEITYQGSISDGGAPVDGLVDMRFTLYDADAGGNVVGTTAVLDGQPGFGAPVDVLNGLFNATPDFGANVFDGTALWLEIEVRIPHDPTDTLAYQVLDPRQPLTAAPVALALRGVRTTPGASGAWNILGGAAENSVTAGSGATIFGGSSSSPNIVTGSAGTISGGRNNTAYEIATVGGGTTNDATGQYSTVAGGGFNSASGRFGIVPGGRSNEAGGHNSMAAGWRAKVRNNQPASPYYSGDGDGDEGTFVWADSIDAEFISTGPNQFLIRAGGGVGIGTTDPQGAAVAINSAGIGFPALVFERDELTYADTKSRLGISSLGGGLGLRLMMSADDGANWTDSLFIHETGSVGIGTTNPDNTLLHVGTGDGTLLKLGNDPELIFTRDTAGNKFNINLGGTGYNGRVLQIGRDDGNHNIAMTGRVGIGTYNLTDEQLAVNGKLRVYNTTETKSVQTWVGTSGAVIDAENAHLQLRVNGTDHVFISNPSGNVGIGTTGPSAKLHVAGTPGVDGIRFPDGTLQTTASRILSVSQSLDPPPMTPGAGANLTVTVTGAIVSDAAVASAGGLITPIAIANVRVSANDTVQIQLVNASLTSTVDLPSMTWRIRVIK